MNEPHPGARLERPDTPEAAALRRLKAAQPQLAGAADMQLEIIALYRRAQTRVTTRVFDLDRAALQDRMAAGSPIVRFADVPFDWSALRGLVRQIADVLKRYELVEPPEHAAVQALVRAGRPDPGEVAAWYEARSPQRQAEAPLPAGSEPSTLSQLLTLASRPFLARAVEMIHQRVDLSPWTLPYCPYCGGDPELGTIPSDGERRLVCGRCAGQWPFDPSRCPFCDNRDAGRFVSFDFACWPDAGRDGTYRFTGCDRCRRYLKSHVARGASRPVMLDVDTIGSLLLDAAAAQRGYVS